MRTLIQELKAYFSEKKTPTEQEKTLLKKLNEGFIPITSLHPKDVEKAKFDTSCISKEQLLELARHMESDYCDSLFWDSLCTWCKRMGFPEKD